MRLLFITGRGLFPFFKGGDGTSIDQLLTGLQNKDIECIACGRLDAKIANHSFEQVSRQLQKIGIKYKRKTNGIEYYTDYHNILFSTKNFTELCFQLIEKYNPTVILTQMEDSDKVIYTAVKMKVPVILYVHDGTVENKKSLSVAGLNFVFYNSIFIQNKFSQTFKIPSKVVYPIFNSNKYQCIKNDASLVTMVNPTYSKGGVILEKLCKEQKDIKFQIVLGWSKELPDIRRLPNVDILEFGLNMREVYESASFVLVPSQWEEPFCRIPIEAGFSKTPSISSNVGGLPESVGNGGILIDDYSNVKMWIDAIYKLYNSEQEINNLGELAFKNSQQFTVENKINEIIATIHQML